ncbi:MAG: phosphoribosyl-ATP diphosphatase [Chloroflexota bacterium]
MFLDELVNVIEDRKQNPRAGSYTNQLFASGEDEILKKVGEEAVELILAAKAQGRQRLIEEAGDLFYHLLVLLSVKGVKLGEIENELRRRHKPEGP